MKDFSYVTQSHPGYIENLYQDYIKSPSSIDPDLRKFFEGFDFAVSTGKLASDTTGKSVALPEGQSVDWMRELNIYRLILGYRNKGHLIAKTNPIRERKDRGANIEITHYILRMDYSF